MSTDLERFIMHRDSTKDEFDSWNEKQPDSRKIRNRLPFTVVWPTAKFSDGIEKKPYIDKKDPTKSGVNSFKKLKATDSQGSETSYRVQLPSVIAPRGLAESKTDSGLIKSLLIVFDLENPDHKITCDNFDKHISIPACHEIMKSPGIFSMPEVKQFLSFDESTFTDVDKAKYAMNMMLIKAKMSKVINLPKKDKNTYIEDSPLRTMFLNPLYYQNPEKTNEPPSEMIVSFKLTPGQPAIAIKPDQFFLLCEGKVVKDGKMVDQKRLGCECAPEVIFTKLNIGSKPSTKSTCTAVTVTRLQEAPRNDTQSEKQNYMDTNGCIDEFTNQLNLEELLAGLSTGNLTTNSSTVITGNSFNPMGIDNNLPTSIGNGIGTVENSLIGSFQKTQTPQEILYQQSSNNQQSLNNQQSSLFSSFPTQLNNTSLSNSNQSMSFSSFPSQINNIPSLNLSNSNDDRLSNFQPSMIPTSTSI